MCVWTNGFGASHFSQLDINKEKETKMRERNRQREEYKNDAKWGEKDEWRMKNKQDEAFIWFSTLNIEKKTTK